MLEKLILALIVTLSIYLRYNPVATHQSLSEIQNYNPQPYTHLVTWKQK